MDDNFYTGNNRITSGRFFVIILRSIQEMKTLKTRLRRRVEVGAEVI